MPKSSKAPLNDGENIATINFQPLSFSRRKRASRPGTLSKIFMGLKQANRSHSNKKYHSATLVSQRVNYYFALNTFFNIKIQAMPIELLTRRDLQEFKEELFHELKNLLAPKELPIHKRILKSKDVIRILRISPGNLQNLRKNETIRYTKIGGIIYYKYEDIEELLNNVRA